jgi:hypothetical protein
MKDETYLLELILGQLERLNRQMADLLCLQKLQGLRNGKSDNPAVGSIPGIKLEGKDSVLNVPIPTAAANPVPCDAHLGIRFVHPGNGDPGADIVPW